MNALGIFVRQPLAGQVKTRLAAVVGDEPAAQLYSAFTIDVVERFRRTAHDRTLCYCPGEPAAQAHFARLARESFRLWPQPEGGLGARLAAFFRHSFGCGSSRVVVVGSDSPTLPVEFVTDAFNRLERYDCVLGPATDGGYYLIGLRAEQGTLFDGIDWDTPRVFAQTVAHVKAVGLSLAVLPPWYDVDDAADLQMLRGHLAALSAAGADRVAENTQRWLELHTGRAATSL